MGEVFDIGKIQKYTEEKNPEYALPFDLRAELGEILTAKVESPGIYYLEVEKDGECRELYVVTPDAPAVSDKARTYGQVFPNYPELRVYDLLQLGSGRSVIEFEICRYQLKCHLPWDKSDDSLYVHALYGAEEHPDYFGYYPVPMYTPRGRTVRHKMIINGAYWLETERCEELLAVCHPISGAISESERGLGERLEYERMMGEENMFGYLFFPKRSSAIPLYELSLVHEEIEASGIVNMPALLNAVCEFYPEYTAMHNEREAEYKNGNVIARTPDAGTDFIRF